MLSSAGDLSLEVCEKHPAVERDFNVAHWYGEYFL
jgi:hypothetical protein